MHYELALGHVVSSHNDVRPLLEDVGAETLITQRPRLDYHCLLACPHWSRIEPNRNQNVLFQNVLNGECLLKLLFNVYRNFDMCL